MSGNLVTAAEEQAPQQSFLIVKFQFSRSWVEEELDRLSYSLVYYTNGTLYPETDLALLKMSDKSVCSSECSDSSVSPTLLFFLLCSSPFLWQLPGGVVMNESPVSHKPVFHPARKSQYRKPLKP